MNANKIFRLGKFITIFLIVYGIAGWLIGTWFDTENFPLSQKWSTRLWGDVRQLSLIDNQIVLARTELEIYAINVQFGQILWHRDTTSGAMIAPALTGNGTIFFVDGDGVQALRQSDGKTIWTQQHLRYIDEAFVAAVSQGVVAVNGGGYLSVLDAANGSVLWSKYVCRNTISPYFYGPNIYVPCFGISVLDIHSGELVAETISADRIWTAGYVDNVMYSSADAEYITAYDLSKQTQIWRTHLSNDANGEFKIMGKLLFFTDTAQVCVMTRNKGDILWCRTERRMQNPVKFNNIAYVFDGSKKIITALDIENGAPIGKLFLRNLNLGLVGWTNEQLMLSTDDLLIFSSGREIFAFGK